MMSKSIKWLQYSIGFIVSLIAIVSIFNYKVDSLGLFGNPNYLSKAAKTLTSGKMIAGLKDYDERFFQELIIKNLLVKNDVIAIGSSKTMLLRKEYFLKKNIDFFNHSVSGASLEDYIAIVGIYELIHGYMPSTIVLGVDPWVFNKNSGQNRWETLSKYYNYEISRIYNQKLITTSNVNAAKWKQLINYDYTISNIKSSTNVYITDTIEIDDSIKAVDGSIYYPYKLRYPDHDKVKTLAVKSAKKPVSSLERYRGFTNTKLFEDFIEYLKLKNVNVIFFLAPYHPIAYDLLVKNEDYQIITQVELHLRELAVKHNIDIKGSYNPHLDNFLNEDFIDAAHANENVIKKIFENE